MPQSRAPAAAAAARKRKKGGEVRDLWDKLHVLNLEEGVDRKAKTKERALDERLVGGEWPVHNPLLEWYLSFAQKGDKDEMLTYEMDGHFHENITEHALGTCCCLQERSIVEKVLEAQALRVRRVQMTALRALLRRCEGRLRTGAFFAWKQLAAVAAQCRAGLQRWALREWSRWSRGGGPVARRLGGVAVRLCRTSALRRVWRGWRRQVLPPGLAHEVEELRARVAALAALQPPGSAASRDSEPLRHDFIRGGSARRRGQGSAEVGSASVSTGSEGSAAPGRRGAAGARGLLSLPPRGAVGTGDWGSPIIIIPSPEDMAASARAQGRARGGGIGEDVSRMLGELEGSSPSPIPGPGRSPSSASTSPGSSAARGSEPRRSLSPQLRGAATAMASTPQIDPYAQRIPVYKVKAPPPSVPRPPPPPLADVGGGRREGTGNASEASTGGGASTPRLGGGGGSLSGWLSAAATPGTAPAAGAGGAQSGGGGGGEPCLGMPSTPPLPSPSSFAGAEAGDKRGAQPPAMHEHAPPSDPSHPWLLPAEEGEGKEGEGGPPPHAPRTVNGWPVAEEIHVGYGPWRVQRPRQGGMPAPARRDAAPASGGGAVAGAGVGSPAPSPPRSRTSSPPRAPSPPHPEGAEHSPHRPSLNNSSDDDAAGEARAQAAASRRLQQYFYGGAPVTGARAADRRHVEAQYLYSRSTHSPPRGGGSPGGGEGGGRRGRGRGTEGGPLMRADPNAVKRIVEGEVRYWLKGGAKENQKSPPRPAGRALLGAEHYLRSADRARRAGFPWPSPSKHGVVVWEAADGALSPSDLDMITRGVGCSSSVRAGAGAGAGRSSKTSAWEELSPLARRIGRDEHYHLAVSEDGRPVRKRLWEQQ